MTAMLKAALSYHNEGLNVIPVVPRQKRPALSAWEEYQTRISTKAEVIKWFDNGPHKTNIGLVHCRLANGEHYVTLDFDHDAGLFEAAKVKFPDWFKGRLEQSGSGEGFHLPLRIDTPPSFGRDQRQGRPRGNRTWKTNKGHCNIRVSHCQTVAPPSVHPSGNQYVFIQEGPVIHVASLFPIIAWLNELTPPPIERLPPQRQRSLTTANGKTLVETVKDAWAEVFDVFQHFGLVTETRQESNGEMRLLGNGGLLVAPSGDWYCFSAEEGGGIIEAWAWCRYGSVEAKRKHFRAILLEMAQVVGIDTAAFYRRGDEHTNVPSDGDKQYWCNQNTRWDRRR